RRKGARGRDHGLPIVLTPDVAGGRARPGARAAWRSGLQGRDGAGGVDPLFTVTGLRALRGGGPARRASQAWWGVTASRFPASALHPRRARSGGAPPLP